MGNLGVVLTEEVGLGTGTEPGAGIEGQSMRDGMEEEKRREVEEKR